MTDLKRDVQDEQGMKKLPDEEHGPERERGAQQGRSRTAGTDRDFDEDRTSDNQGHGHPREERGQKS